VRKGRWDYKTMKKSEKTEQTKEKLMRATFELMQELDSPLEVTSRAIAQRANIQAAMINYCFGSREALIFKVFQTMSLEHFEPSRQLNEIVQQDLSAKDKLKEVYFCVLKYLMLNEKFALAITKYVLLNRDLTMDLHSFQFVYEHYKEQKSEQECKLIAYELTSIFQLIIYRHKDLGVFCGLNLETDDELKIFISKQVDLFLV